jgi:BirA family biotin operon repressor/biotin-[acetyl-CoA-carboxylase] ligase
MDVSLRRVESIPSTQDLLHELAQAGADSGTAVVAAEQTLGRGSRGRGWESPRGGLWLSVLLRPGSEPALEVLSLRVALAVAKAIEQAVPGVRLGLKWPNDLLLGQRKVGGILCEARWQGGTPGWVAVGVGINVGNPIPPGLESRAVALATVVPGLTPESLAEPVAEAVAALAHARGHLSAGELREVRSRDALLRRRILEPEAGIAEGVAADGTLRVRRADGSVIGARSGSVRLADD